LQQHAATQAAWQLPHQDNSEKSACADKVVAFVERLIGVQVHLVEQRLVVKTCSFGLGEVKGEVREVDDNGHVNSSGSGVVVQKGKRDMDGPSGVWEWQWLPLGKAIDKLQSRGGGIGRADKAWQATVLYKMHANVLAISTTHQSAASTGHVALSPTTDDQLRRWQQMQLKWESLQEQEQKQEQEQEQEQENGVYMRQQQLERQQRQQRRQQQRYQKQKQQKQEEQEQEPKQEEQEQQQQ
jgi:hypothetical protein